MVCFALYAASRATTQAYRRVLEEWDLTYPQYLVLVELWSRGPLTVSELGADLALDSGTLSPLLGRMERAGLITRDRDRPDARVVTVTLTARGQAMRAELAGVPVAIARALGIEPDGAPVLISDLRRLTRSLQQAAAPAPNPPPRER
jgi:DNA-binding MarR family transcriptional regulator